ncbi:hypothetical protein C6496_06175 [Candidatus Poribacteria bacterium]|nr:MAG: hypothetical protein C6496_06175 [Candidatus Poribacteria bacterium]
MKPKPCKGGMFIVRGSLQNPSPVRAICVEYEQKWLIFALLYAILTLSNPQSHRSIKQKLENKII